MKFCEKHFEKNFCHKFPVLKRKFNKFIKKKDSPKIVTIACNMKGCLIFSTFILWIVPNLVKYTYGWLSLEQYPKIGKKIWCYSFNQSTSPNRRRLQYTYFGTVQTLIKLIWDGPTKGKYLNFGVPSQKGGKKPFGVPRPHYKLIRVTLYYVI